MTLGKKSLINKSVSTIAQQVGVFIFGFLQDSISLLLEAVRTRNEELAQTWKKSEQWATIEQLCSKCPCPPITRAQGTGHYSVSL